MDNSTNKKDIIIEVNNVSRCFNLARERVDSLKEYFVRKVKGNLHFEEFWALKDVSFTVERGDAVGLIGLNGSGKSTMLKVIAGVLKPTEGSARVSGSVAPLIELGAGFDPDLTARENIFLNGALLGHPRSVMKEAYDSIVDFAELREFMDVPVKNFSSGMNSRLAFSIATIGKPDILIVDEVLAVGDSKFQEKCINRIEEMMAKGTTVLFVSHSIRQVEMVCNKVVWLEHGHLKKYGPTMEICEEYKSLYKGMDIR
ncbi:MAG: ABC transporter ATP-binding protein [Lachnospiraceae bacterium]